MFRKIFVTSILLICAVAVSAQQYTVKNLIGRWENTRYNASNLIFLTDSTGAWLASDGFIYNKMTYSAKADKDIIELKYTVEPNRKHPRYEHPQIKFINDSTFLIRMMWGIPNGADTSNKKVGVFRKIKETPATAMRLPGYNDLLGVWVSKFKDSTKFQKFTFVDKSILYIQTSTQGLHKFTYKADFTQQPVTLDIYYDDKLVKQGFLGFYGKDGIRLELFNTDKRGDHFTVMGPNMHLYRNKKADPAFYLQQN